MKKLILFVISVCMFSTMAFAEELFARAVIKASEEAVLSSEIAAKIIKLPYSEGKSFKKGHSLVKFDCSIYRAQLNKVAAELEGAKYELVNNKKLEEMNSIGVMEVAKSKFNVKITQAELRIASLAVRRCNIVAPFSGKVIKKYVQRYETVKQNQELLHIVNINKLESHIIVASKWLKNIKVKQLIKILVEDVGKSYDAVISAIIPNVDPVSQTISIKATIVKPDNMLLPGMSGRVSF